MVLARPTVGTKTLSLLTQLSEPHGFLNCEAGSCCGGWGKGHWGKVRLLCFAQCKGAYTHTRVGIPATAGDAGCSSLPQFSGNWSWILWTSYSCYMPVISHRRELPAPSVHDRTIEVSRTTLDFSVEYLALWCSKIIFRVARSQFGQTSKPFCHLSWTSYLNPVLINHIFSLWLTHSPDIDNT